MQAMGSAQGFRRLGRSGQGVRRPRPPLRLAPTGQALAGERASQVRGRRIFKYCVGEVLYLGPLVVAGGCGNAWAYRRLSAYPAPLPASALHNGRFSAACRLRQAAKKRPLCKADADRGGPGCRVGGVPKPCRICPQLLAAQMQDLMPESARLLRPLLPRSFALPESFEGPPHSTTSQPHVRAPRRVGQRASSHALRYARCVAETALVWESARWRCICQQAKRRLSCLRLDSSRGGARARACMCVASQPRRHYVPTFSAQVALVACAWMSAFLLVHVPPSAEHRLCELRLAFRAAWPSSLAPFWCSLCPVCGRPCFKVLGCVVL